MAELKTADDRERLKRLFRQLDKNNDGKVDSSELLSAVKQSKSAHSENEHSGAVQRILTSSDSDADGELDLNEFMRYVSDQEKKLQLVFTSIDTDRDGKLTAKEIQSCMEKLGCNIDDAEAMQLVKRVDKDGSLAVDFSEFRDHFYLQHDATLQSVLRLWRRSTLMDVGDGTPIPDDYTQEEIQTGLWWRNLLAGAGAGAVSRTATAPLDRLKVMLQVHGHDKNITIRSGFQHMLKEGGLGSLWRGNGTNVLKIAPESALKFMAYEQCKKLVVGDRSTEIKGYERMMAGSMAGLGAQTAIYPMEVLKTRLCLRKTGQYSGLYDCARKILKSEGIGSFYRGYIPNAIGIIPYAGIDLAVYETLKNSYRASRGDAEPPITIILCCGAISSSCGQLASYPLALIRTKLQAKGSDLKKSDGMVSMARSIWHKEGPRGFYRGIVPNFMKVIPAVSISYVVYEKIRQQLGVKSK